MGRRCRGTTGTGADESRRAVVVAAGTEWSRRWPWKPAARRLSRTAVSSLRDDLAVGQPRRLRRLDQDSMSTCLREVLGGCGKGRQLRGRGRRGGGGSSSIAAVGGPAVTDHARAVRRASVPWLAWQPAQSSGACSRVAADTAVLRRACDRPAQRSRRRPRRRR